MSTLWQNTPGAMFGFGNYDGTCSIKELKEHGGYGVGEFESLNGELVAIDGRYYRATADGRFTLAGDEDRACFAVISDFQPTDFSPLPQDASQSRVEKFLDAHLGSKDQAFALVIKGLFSEAITRAVPRQQKPYLPFEEVLKSQVVRKFTDVPGTLFGIFSPDFYGQIGVPGYHYHFAADDERGGGHVLGFSLSQGEVAHSRVERLIVDAPAYE